MKAGSLSFVESQLRHFVKGKAGALFASAHWSDVWQNASPPLCDAQPRRPVSMPSMMPEAEHAHGSSSKSESLDSPGPHMNVQLVPLSAPSADQSPSGQGSHVVAPKDAEKVPAVHGEQGDDPPSPKFPGKQEPVDQSGGTHRPVSSCRT